MGEIELSAGTIEYEDTGGEGPVVVLLHGFFMDSSLWAPVMAGLADAHRCVAPTLPLGAHRHAVASGADLSLRGQAALVGELLEALELTEVTVVGNDTGGAITQLLLCQRPTRVQRVVLVSCEAFENYPPGLPGRTLTLAGRLSPPLLGLLMAPLRLRPVRRLPMAWGWLTRYGDPATVRWLQPVLRRRDIRRDFVRALRTAAAEPGVMLEAADCLPGFDGAALVVWAREDRVMPPAHGRRLAERLPRARLVEVPDSYTLVAQDQPARLAELIREFVAEPLAPTA